MAEAWNGVQLIAWIRWRDDVLVMRYALPATKAVEIRPDGRDVHEPHDEPIEGAGPRPYVLPPGLMKWGTARDQATDALRAGEVIAYNAIGAAVSAACGYTTSQPTYRRRPGYFASDVRDHWRKPPPGKPTQEDVTTWIVAYLTEHPRAKRDAELFPACRDVWGTKAQMEAAMRDRALRVSNACGSTEIAQSNRPVR